MAGGLSDAGLAGVRDAVARHVGDERVPGVVALVSQGDQVQVEARGSLTIGGAAVARDSIFRIASTTKPITAVATLALVGEGLFGLDEPVDRLLPELANRRVLRRPDGPLTDTIAAERAVTTRDLLTFTWGFGMQGAMFTAPEPWPIVTAVAERELGAFGPPQPDTTPEPDTWMARLGELPLLAQPGERWLYSAGSQVLGVLAARAAGAPFGDVMREQVLAPLGMDDTAFYANDTSRLATAYERRDGKLEVSDPPDGQLSRPPRFPDGAGGLVSTAEDLLRFGRMLLLPGGNPVLTAETVAEMTRDQLTPAQRANAWPGFSFLDDRGWGYGVSVTEWGYAWDGGLGTSWRSDPKEEMVGILMTQRAWESPTPPPVTVDFWTSAYQAIDD